MKVLKMKLDTDSLRVMKITAENILMKRCKFIEKSDFRWAMSQETFNTIDTEIATRWIFLSSDSTRTLFGTLILIDNSLPLGEVKLLVDSETL